MYQTIIVLRGFIAITVTAKTVNLTIENDILHGINNDDGIIAVNFAPFKI
jgi:hypothetical protein